MRLISIGRIYLLKSSEAERCILPDDAHRKPPARANRAKTAPKSNSAQSGHLADQQKYHSYVSVLLRKGAFKVFRFQSAPSQASFSVCPCPKRSFTSARIPSSLYAPKASLVFARTQGTPLRLPETKAPLELACAQSLFMPSRVQSSTSQLLESKAPLHDCPHPKPPCPPGSKDPPRVRPSLKHPSCSPRS